jgi:ring-1,2-phenylacetyl-CoA epoxidase subunit PaaC
MVTVDARAALLLALADDELVLGQRDAEWTGIAPCVEEDVAFSAIAQDEIGHALALYHLAGEWLGTSAGSLALDRPPEDFRHARIIEEPRGDFAFTIVRRFVYELADQLRIDDLVGSSWTALAELSGKIAAEEVLHRDHARLWLRRLSARDPGRSRVDAALRAILPRARALLAPLDVEGQLLAEGILSRPWRALGQAWCHALVGELAHAGFGELGRELLEGDTPNDRFAPPSPTFLAMHRELVEVRHFGGAQRW